MLNDKTGMQTPVGSGNYRKYNPVSSTKKTTRAKRRGKREIYGNIKVLQRNRIYSIDR